MPLTVPFVNSEKRARLVYSTTSTEHMTLNGPTLGVFVYQNEIEREKETGTY